MAQRKKTIAVLVAVLLIASCGCVLAQAQKSSPPPQGGGTAEVDARIDQAINAMFQGMDANNDGKISKSEWTAFQDKQFKQLDRNGDGFITKEEVRAGMLERMNQERERMGK